MKKFYLLILLGGLFVFSSCMQTKYVISKTILDKSMDSIKCQLHDEGYYLIGVASNTSNENVVAGISYSQYTGFGTAMTNKYITQDTYKFVDTFGNSMSYSISYLMKQSRDSIPYVEELNLCGCETSNPKDYDKFCGSGGIGNRVKKIPNNQAVQLLDEGITVLTFAGVISISILFFWLLSRK